MGGMAAQIPIKGRPQANEAAIAKVRADKEREAGDGHDGTWVAHPGLARSPRRSSTRLMPGPTSSALREDVHVTRADLLQVPTGRDHRGRACATTSASACSTSRRGCAATAACRSTT
jgi:malate synthase